MPGIPRNVIAQVFVFCLIELGKKEVEQGVNHWVSREVKFQVRLGYVGRLMRTVDQNVVPWLVTIGLGLIRLIPSVCGLASRIGIDDESTVGVGEVADNLTRAEERRFLLWGKSLV